MSDKRHTARDARRRQRRSEKRDAKLKAFDDFNQVANPDNLCAAFKKSRREVSWKESVQRYEANLLPNILDARKKLLAGESVQKGFKEFTLNERGKIRHIKSVHISERVVQKSLALNVLIPILEASLIYDNGASIKGKGIHFALRRLIEHLRRFYRTNGNSNAGYALLIDFAKFFDNIDHEILLQQLRTRIKDERIITLIKQFISAFGEGKSLGLGSEVSQICAVYYPSRLDHFIKEKLKVKYYGRYMDDMYLIHADKVFLQQCLYEIKQMCDTLKITLNEKKTRIVKLSQGVVFLKGRYILSSTGKIIKLAGKSSTTRMRRKLKKFKRLLDAGNMSYLDVRTAYQSWRGNYKKRFNAYYRVCDMDKLYNSIILQDTF